MGDQDSNSAKKQFVEHQSYLFDDLIIQEILTRLPVKSILRFKSVSKQWYSTLSSSDFANAHLLKSPLAYPSAPVNCLFIKSGKNFYLFSYDDDQISANFEDNLVKLDLDHGFEKDDLRLTGSCNGLVCLTPSSGKYFVLWNPATRKMHKYETDVDINRVDDEFKFRKFREVTCGFWYASSVDDYRFIRTLKRSLRTGDINCIGHIFSVRENKWTRFDYDCGHDFIVTRTAMLTNDRLYWPAVIPPTDFIILSFDLVVERFDVVKVERRDNLGVMGGCLSKYNFDRECKVDKLRHIYESPWVIMKSICLPKGLGLGMASQMIGFTRAGKFFVTGAFNDKVIDFEIRMLGVVDTATKPMQYTTLLRFNEKIEIARFVPSLVSPFPIEDELSTA